MYVSSKPKKPPKPKDLGLEVLQKLHAESLAFIEGNAPEVAVEPSTDIQRYQTVLENISEGVCYFNGKQQLVLCNTRYAEMYNLKPQDIPIGTTLRDIVARRLAVGTGPAVGIEDYLSESTVVNQTSAPSSKTTKLADGREIAIRNQHMPDGGWVSTHDDITEGKKQSTSLQTLIDWVPEILFVKDRDSRFLVANEATATDLSSVANAKSVSRSDLIGKTDFDFYPPEVAQMFRASEEKIMQSGKRIDDLQEPTTNRFGQPKWIAMTKVPLRNDDGEVFGLVGIGRDISKQKKDESLREGQSAILELIAMSAPITKILDQLVYLIESQLTGIVCSILLLDEDGVHLRHGSAPNLPEDYCKAIDGIEIGPNVGSCGTAAYRQKPVIVYDIMTDPLWADYRGLAEQHNLRSCWSTPILSHEGGVLGTLALYSATVREPTAADMRLINVSTRIAGIALQRKLAEDRIQFLATHDALTHLPNRALLKDRLAQAISHAERNDCCVSVIFIDLDKFKEINDSLGHNAGDELLKTVAKRM
ncbi:MAG: PAS-domain containing protein, partial [Aestuariivirga sp.]